MSIKDALWLLAHSKEAEDRRQWAVLYWKHQGLTHRQVGAKLGKSENWVQRYMTMIYKTFDTPDIPDKEEKFQWLIDNVFPALRELLEHNPGIPELLEPEDEEDDPDKSVVISPPGKIIHIPRRRPNYLLLILALFLVVLALSYGAFQMGRQTVIPTVVTVVTQVVTEVLPTSPPTATLPPTTTPTPTVPTETPTETPLPVKSDFYPAGQWVDFSNGIYVRLNDDLYSMPDCRPLGDQFAVELQFHYEGGQYLVRYDSSAFHASDDTGKVYKLLGAGHIFCNEIGIQNLDSNNRDIHITLLFDGSFPLEAKYIVITADSINGVKLVFHKLL